MLVAVGVGCVPIALVWAANGFEVGSGEIFRLIVAVVPVALAVGWWLGWRMVRPVEQLRDAALARALDAAPGQGFDLGRTDEFGALAIALDTLVGRLEQQNAANEAFVADLAHELKNPLAAILTVAERLEADAVRGGEVDPARVGRMAGILQRSGARLDALVSELLELARTEGGLRDEDWQPVDLAALATGVTERFAQDPRYEHVRFAVDAPAPVWVLGVPGRLESALMNLVDNAASFNTPEALQAAASAHPDGQPVTEGERAGDGAGDNEGSGQPGGAVRVAAQVDGDRAVLTVADTGAGIAAEDLPRVFDRFFTTRAGHRRGTGLGLALVQAVARAHRGDATVTSEPWVETVFRLCLWVDQR